MKQKKQTSLFSQFKRQTMISLISV